MKIRRGTFNIQHSTSNAEVLPFVGRINGLRVTARRFSDPHPRNQKIEAVVRLDWPSYAETHFPCMSAALAMVRRHVGN